MRKQILTNFDAKAILVLIISCFFLISYGYSSHKENTKSSLKNNNYSLTNNSFNSIKAKSDKFFTLDKVIIILSHELDPKSKILNVQDYIENGKSFIPIFSSPEKFKESTKGADLGKKIIEINPYLLLSVLSGKETLRINPTLSDETYFNASDLKQIYKSEIESFLAKLPK